MKNSLSANDGDADDPDSTEADHDDDPHSVEAESITNPDEDAPDTQAERLKIFKDTLHESTKNGECLTGDELEAKLGWEREIIDDILEKLRRDGTVHGEGYFGFQLTLE